MPTSNHFNNLQSVWESDFIQLLEDTELKCGVALATDEYIPIEEFKTAFNKAKKVAKEKNWQAIIFDKRKLTVFHQPSMEWYYTEWKKELAEFGLTKHFKILPKENWFKASVEAGIKDIKSKHPDFDFSAFTVTYVKSIDEALDILEQD